MPAKRHQWFGVLEPGHSPQACSSLYSIRKHQYLACWSMLSSGHQTPHLSHVTQGSSSELTGQWPMTVQLGTRAQIQVQEASRAGIGDCGCCNRVALSKMAMVAHSLSWNSFHLLIYSLIFLKSLIKHSLCAKCKTQPLTSERWQSNKTALRRYIWGTKGVTVLFPVF